MMTIIDERMIILSSKARAFVKKMCALIKKTCRMNAMMRSYFVDFGGILAFVCKNVEFKGPFKDTCNIKIDIFFKRLALSPPSLLSRHAHEEGWRLSSVQEC